MLNIQGLQKSDRMQNLKDSLLKACLDVSCEWMVSGGILVSVLRL